MQYITEASEQIKRMAHWEVNVEVDIFHANSGVNRLVSGLFKGKTLVYSDLNHVVLRILPKYSSEAGENAILVSSHIDTVFSTYASIIFKICTFYARESPYLFIWDLFIKVACFYYCCSQW